MLLHATTILSQSSRQLRLQVAEVLKQRPSNSTVLFSLSSNIEAETLSTLVAYFRDLPNETLGCITAPVPGYNTPSRPLCASIAVLRNHSTTVFRSTISGQAPAQVGRWHSSERMKQSQSSSTSPFSVPETVDWQSMWDNSSQASASIPELEGLRLTERGTILYMSDMAPEGLMRSLDDFQGWTKIGLRASSTPFLTGRAVTLFHNDQIYDSGAVGVAMISTKDVPSLQVTFPNHRPLSKVFVVTESDGNLIHSLDGGNPAQFLLNAMTSAGFDLKSSSSFKDNEEFFLAFVDHNKEPLQMYGVLSGDPSRGTIALDSGVAPTVGSLVQFFSQSHMEKKQMLVPRSTQTNPSIHLSTSFKDSVYSLANEDSINTSKHNQPILLQNEFVASSENGMLTGVALGRSWLCTVPGSSAKMQFM